jgi:hypothetical protein
MKHAFWKISICKLKLSSDHLIFRDCLKRLERISKAFGKNKNVPVLGMIASFRKCAHGISQFTRPPEVNSGETRRKDSFREH